MCLLLMYSTGTCLFTHAGATTDLSAEKPAFHPSQISEAHKNPLCVIMERHEILCMVNQGGTKYLYLSQGPSLGSNRENLRVLEAPIIL